MKDLLEHALDVAAGSGATHAEARIVSSAKENYEVKNGAPDAALQSSSEGLGVRVIAGGAWGFAALPELTKSGAERAARQAVDVARASATAATQPVVLAPAPKVAGVYVTPHRVDPIAVPVGKKIGLLMKAEAAMHGRPCVTITQAFLTVLRKRTWFATSEGSSYDQTIFECGGGIAATAVRDGDWQIRSYPNSFRGNFGTGSSGDTILISVWRSSGDTILIS